MHMKTPLTYSMILAALVLTTACGQTKKGQVVTSSQGVTSDNIDQTTLASILGNYTGYVTINGVPGSYQLRLTTKDYPSGGTYLYGEMIATANNRSYLIQIPSDISTPSYMGMFQMNDQSGRYYVFASSYQWIQMASRWTSLEYTFRGNGSYALELKDCSGNQGDRCLNTMSGFQFSPPVKQ